MTSWQLRPQEGFQARELTGELLLPGSFFSVSQLPLVSHWPERHPGSIPKPITGKRPRAPRLIYTNQDPSPVAWLVATSLEAQAHKEKVLVGILWGQEAGDRYQ